MNSPSIKPSAAARKFYSLALRARVLCCRLVCPGAGAFPGRSFPTALAMVLATTANLCVAGETLDVDRLPVISPDYTGIEIPPNIAPLNFCVTEPATLYQVEIASQTGKPIRLSSRTGSFRLPPKQWHALLESNRGQSFLVALSTRDASGQWTRFRVITNSISRDPIDPYLAYRRLHPLFSLYGTGNLGVFQRNLEKFAESAILEVKERTRENPWCMNCHTFHNRSPETFGLHLRSREEKSMILVRDGKPSKLGLLGGYMSWHPSGKLIAFSQNKLSLFFHTVGETRDVYDANSDLAVYYLDSNLTASPAPIARTNCLENWPQWSPDGRYLYYCSMPASSFDHYREARYDLIRVGYNPASDTWGTNETLLRAADLGRSLVQPRPSPDGRFLVFTACDYGHFPIYQTNSTQHLMELNTGRHWRLELNSGRGETWHCWSGNSRWLVFSSKRLNRLLARPFFSHIDEQGRATKPFVLPQEDPLFYDTCLKTFNVPEFISGPVLVSKRQMLKALANPSAVQPGGVEPAFQQSGESGD